MKDKNTVLVAIINSKSDFEIAKKDNWYRIPVKSAPAIVKNGEIKFLAFYHTKVFEKERFTIQYYAPVKKITVVKRNVLFPDLEFDPKANNEYYKIEADHLERLPTPIISLRHRRLLFIPTTESKFFNATEINYLFNDSPLEDLLWNKFVQKNITAERQFFISIRNCNYFLDFAIFCKERNINVECDGDLFHNTSSRVQADKQRNNLLESIGWSVLRFTTYDLSKNMENSISIVHDTINKYGGVQNIDDLENYRYIRKDDEPQLFLFG